MAARSTASRPLPIHEPLPGVRLRPYENYLGVSHHGDTVHVDCNAVHVHGNVAPYLNTEVVVCTPGAQQRTAIPFAESARDIRALFDHNGDLYVTAVHPLGDLDITLAHRFDRKHAFREARSSVPPMTAPLAFFDSGHYVALTLKTKRRELALHSPHGNLVEHLGDLPLDLPVAAAVAATTLYVLLGNRVFATHIAFAAETSAAPTFVPADKRKAAHKDLWHTRLGDPDDSVVYDSIAYDAPSHTLLVNGARVAVALDASDGTLVNTFHDPPYRALQVRDSGVLVKWERGTPGWERFEPK